LFRSGTLEFSGYKQNSIAPMANRRGGPEYTWMDANSIAERLDDFVIILCCVDYDTNIGCRKLRRILKIH
jgi:hypothetical protein